MSLELSSSTHSLLFGDHVEVLSPAEDVVRLRFALPVCGGKALAAGVGPTHPAFRCSPPGVTRPRPSRFCTCADVGSSWSWSFIIFGFLFLLRG